MTSSGAVPQNREMPETPISADARVGHVHLKDHGVSEAVYLRDPDGNGIELYHDRPMEEWPRDEDGGLAMYTRSLDIESLLASGGS